MIDTKTILKYKKLFYRVLWLIAGITTISAGLTFMRYANFGIDPLSCLNTGISNKIGMSFGTWQLVFFAPMIIGVFIFDRSKIGFGTLYNMLTIGYTSDFFLWLINKIYIFESFSIQTRIISFIFGFPVLYFGAAVYIETNMGIAPYDAIAIIIAEKIKKQNWFRWIRIGTDALCVTGGILTQSAGVGAGTLLTVLFAGPLIAFFRKLKALQIIQK
ncbi:MAG: hypothetical protein Pg6A_01580 [Termitinemataceae bacterium]|nr:MAG: hypothetical protein Pg6A_01580 [Termitinemataceae bacterium]